MIATCLQSRSRPHAKQKAPSVPVLQLALSESPDCPLGPGGASEPVGWQPPQPLGPHLLYQLRRRTRLQPVELLGLSPGRLLAPEVRSPHLVRCPGAHIPLLGPQWLLVALSQPVMPHVSVSSGWASSSPVTPSSSDHTGGGGVHDHVPTVTMLASTTDSVRASPPTLPHCGGRLRARWPPR